MTVADQLTLVDTERKAHQLILDLGRAQQQLAQARDEEVNAKHEYESARRKLVLSVDCPRVGSAREGGKVTTAERDAWVDSHCEDEEHVYNIAVVKREAAQSHLFTLRDQSMLVMSLSRSIQISMGLAGHSEPQWSR
jgi:hypothetical protein